MTMPIPTRDEIQAEANESILESWEDGESTVNQMPTQVGKTRAACKLIKHTIAEEHARWIVQVHLGELINQWGDELTAMGIPFFVEKGTLRAMDKMRISPEVRVCLASQPSLKGARLTEIPRDFFTHVALDECHLSVAPSWIASSDHFRAKKLGVSATIDRLDGVPLGTQYDSMAYVYPITQAIRNGHRAPFRSVQAEIPVDMRGLKPKDVAAFGTAEVAARLMPKLEPIARVFAEHIERLRIRKWIAFLPNRQCSLGFANLMTGLAHPARHVDFESPDRVSVIRSHKAGDYEGLCNFKLLGMGYSDPEIQAVLLLQPTNSRAWLDQMCLDESTEVLTRRGWLGRQDINKSDEVATMDRITGEALWSPIRQIFDRPLSPEEGIYRASGPSTDIRITDRHRVLWKCRGDSRWTLSPVREVERHQYQIPVSAIEGVPGLQLTDDEIRFIGWLVTDGHVGKDRRTITISQDFNSPFCGEIERVLNSCGFRWSDYPQVRSTNYSPCSRIHRYSISRGSPHRISERHLRGWGDLDRFIDKDFSPALEGLNRRQLLVLIDAMNMGDGAKPNPIGWTSRSWHIVKGNKTMADRLQSLCVRRGLKCSVSTQRYNKNPLYVIHIKDVTTSSFSKGNGHTCFQESVTIPGERVWCVETDQGTIFTRRNGKVAILGNCGRSGATHPDKDYAYLLYPRWIADIELMGPTDIFSGDMNARVRQKARKLNEDQEESDPEDVLAEAQKEIDREDADREEEIEDTRQRALRYHVEPGKFDHVWKEFDPLARYGIVRALVPAEALSPVAHDTSRATEGQARVIRGYGLDPEGMTAVAAGLLAEKLMARDLANLADGRDVQALMKLCGLTPEAAMGYTRDAAATRIRLELSRRNLRRSRPA